MIALVDPYDRLDRLAIAYQVARDAYLAALLVVEPGIPDPIDLDTVPHPGLTPGVRYRPLPMGWSPLFPGTDLAAPPRAALDLVIAGAEVVYTRETAPAPKRRRLSLLPRRTA